MGAALRIAAIGAAAALALQPVAAASQPARKPQRIMTMNLCTDMLALQLVPPERIVAVTYLAHEAVEQLWPGRDRGIAVNYGTAEDILKFKPDLIVAGELSTAATRRMARQVGARIIEVKSVRDFQGVRDVVRQVGRAAGEPARAEAVVREMDARLAWLAANPPRRKLRVAAWNGAITIPGKDTLANAVIEAAGAVNIAARPGATYTTFDIEQLLAADPDALLFGGVSADKPSLQVQQARHRVVRRHYGDRLVAYNELGATCGLPQSAETALELRRALSAVPARTGRLR